VFDLDLKSRCSAVTLALRVHPFSCPKALKCKLQMYQLQRRTWAPIPGEGHGARREHKKGTRASSGRGQAPGTRAGSGGAARKANPSWVQL